MIRTSEIEKITIDVLDQGEHEDEEIKILSRCIEQSFEFMG
jgi:hypothetical protein